MYRDQQILIHFTRQFYSPGISLQGKVYPHHCNCFAPVFDHYMIYRDTQNTVLYMSVQDMIYCLAILEMFNLGEHNCQDVFIFPKMWQC